MNVIERGSANVARRLGPSRMARLNLARVLFGRRKTILLFSHMRSYSSLLGHLLGSHPQIDGYAEHHLSYRTFDDLIELRLGVWRITGHDARGDFVFDKLLHNRCQISDEILARRDLKPIYGLREPIGSLRSIVAMDRRLRVPGSRSEPEKAARHLLNRYRAVTELAERRPRAAVVFMDSIVAAPEPTLEQLTRYLGLDSPLLPAYAVQSKTKVGGFGDPVGPIDAGTIVTDRPHHDVEIADELARRLDDAYRSAADRLVQRCSTTIGGPVEVR